MKCSPFAPGVAAFGFLSNDGSRWNSSRWLKLVFREDSDIDYPQKLSGSNTCTTINQRAAGRLFFDRRCLCWVWRGKPTEPNFLSPLVLWAPPYSLVFPSTIRLWLANVGPMTRATFRTQPTTKRMKSESERTHRKECHVFPQTCNQNTAARLTFCQSRFQESFFIFSLLIGWKKSRLFTCHCLIVCLSPGFAHSMVFIVEFYLIGSRWDFHKGRFFFLSFYNRPIDFVIGLL